MIGKLRAAQTNVYAVAKKATTLAGQILNAHLPLVEVWKAKPCCLLRNRRPTIGAKAFAILNASPHANDPLLVRSRITKEITNLPNK